jgi:hypothetical protein
MKEIPSTEPVVEKAQHEPHWPWFLTGVTAPFADQSTDVGSAETFERRSARLTFFERFSCAR